MTEESARKFGFTQIYSDVVSGIAAPENGDDPQNGHVTRHSASSRSDQDGSAGLSATLDVVRRLYHRVRLRDIRSDRAVRLFVAGAGLLLREAHRHPERFNQECKEAGIKGGKK